MPTSLKAKQQILSTAPSSAHQVSYKRGFKATRPLTVTLSFPAVSCQYSHLGLSLKVISFKVPCPQPQRKDQAKLGAGTVF